MKLKDVARGSWAVKPVPLRLVNTVEAAQPGQPPSGAPVTVTVGVRVLLGEETRAVYEKAHADAVAGGLTKWEDEHPICRLALMVRTLAICCVDVDSDPKNPEPFFSGGVEEILSSKNVGADNIAYLFERFHDFVDDCSIETKTMTANEVVGLLLAEAERPENADGPFVTMRPGLRLSCWRTTAKMFSILLMNKSDSTSLEGIDTGNDTKSATEQH